MNNISEEAKEALANASLIKARKRLARDGYHTDAAMQRRLMVLVTERNLPPAEYAKLFHKRILMGSILDFCKRHDVSLDWLMDGSLKGLARMKKWQPATPKGEDPHAAQLEAFWKAFEGMDKCLRSAALKHLQITQHQAD